MNRKWSRAEQIGLYGGIGAIFVTITGTVLGALAAPLGWLLVGSSAGATVVVVVGILFVLKPPPAEPVPLVDQLTKLVTDVEEARAEVSRRHGLVARAEADQPDRMGWDPKAFAEATNTLMDEKILLYAGERDLDYRERLLAEAKAALGGAPSTPSERRVIELREELKIVEAAIQEALDGRVVAMSHGVPGTTEDRRFYGAVVRNEVQLWDHIRARREQLYAHISGELLLSDEPAEL